MCCAWQSFGPNEDSLFFWKPVHFNGRLSSISMDYCELDEWGPLWMSSKWWSEVTLTFLIRKATRKTQGLMVHCLSCERQNFKCCCGDFLAEFPVFVGTCQNMLTATSDQWSTSKAPSKHLNKHPHSADLLKQQQRDFSVYPILLAKIVWSPLLRI